MSELESAQTVCPDCGSRYVIKPPFNSKFRCQKCRWRDGFTNDRGLTE